MLFFQTGKKAPKSSKRLLIAEYAVLQSAADIVEIIDAVALAADDMISELGDDYTLRSVGRSMSGDLRTLAFLWDAKSTARANDASKFARTELKSVRRKLGRVTPHFLEPTAYDARATLPPGPSALAGVLKLRRAGGSTVKNVEIQCGLHDHISLRSNSLADFIKEAEKLVPSFELATQWKFSGAGIPVGVKDKVLHFWRLNGLANVPDAMSVLADFPAYAQIQEFIEQERQDFYMQARGDLRVGIAARGRKKRNK